MLILDSLQKLHSARPSEFHKEVLSVSSFLLNQCRLVVGEEVRRLVEVELYYHSELHPDPFVHRDPKQKEFGRWYLHRKGGTLKNGTFKGIDFTFGTTDAFAAFLIRSLEDSSGRIIDGSCLCVEFLMEKMGPSQLTHCETGWKDREFVRPRIV